MKPYKKKNPIKKNLRKALLILSYFPISSCLIGLLAFHMRFPSPVVGRYPFWDVFQYYAIPFYSIYASMRIPALIFSLVLLIFLVTLVDTKKTIISLTQIRVLLLILIVLVTVFVNIFVIVRPFNTKEFSFIYLFLYSEVDLILLYLLTYLPYFRKLKPNKNNF